MEIWHWTQSRPLKDETIRPFRKSAWELDHYRCRTLHLWEAVVSSVPTTGCCFGYEMTKYTQKIYLSTLGPLKREFYRLLGNLIRTSVDQFSHN